jgi:hypothetical protein
MAEYWKINYTENGEQKEDTLTTFEEFETKIFEVWKIDSLAIATSGSNA